MKPYGGRSDLGVHSEARKRALCVLGAGKKLVCKGNSAASGGWREMCHKIKIKLLGTGKKIWILFVM